MTTTKTTGMHNNQQQAEDNKSSLQPAPHQEESDPQLTELRGFVDQNEDLEPTLADGTKAPDKATEENRINNAGENP